MPATRSTKAGEELYLGAMSGTSLDGIDITLLCFTPSQQGLQAATVAHHHTTYSDEFRRQLRCLCEGQQVTLSELMQTDGQLAEMIANGACELLQQQGLASHQIVAIGSHGQTIRHLPPGEDGSRGYTLQIGDPATIANRSGITTVGDFRRADMAAGGHGAPLAPAFHQAFFSAETARAVVNIGGMANVSLLQPGQTLLGYDTGPGNVLMDAWAARHLQQPYDKNGQWAAQGSVDKALLHSLLAHPFFSQAPPKSTGRESFNLDWLEQQLHSSGAVTPVDVQATLLELTATSVAQSIANHGSFPEIFICGGGAYNGQLLKQLRTHIPDASIRSTEYLGIAPELVECCTFAWLARQTLHGQATPLSNVTGSCSDNVVAGAIYPAPITGS